jgi:hypothetical protein
VAETGPRVGEAAWRGPHRFSTGQRRPAALGRRRASPEYGAAPPSSWPCHSLGKRASPLSVRWEAQAGPHAEGVHCTPRSAATITPCVFGPPGSYAKGSEAARNSTFTRAAPVRTISSRRAAS